MYSVKMLTLILIIINSTIIGGGKYIVLEFISMITECSYDYLFVYDGLSYNSSLIGSFSGESIPDKLLATSGYVCYVIFVHNDKVSLIYHFIFLQCNVC